MTRILENRVSVRGRGVQRCLRNETIKIYTDDKSYVSLGRVTKEELPVYGRNWKTFFNSLICPRKKTPYTKFCGETFFTTRHAPRSVFNSNAKPRQMKDWFRPLSNNCYKIKSAQISAWSAMLSARAV